MNPSLPLADLLIQSRLNGNVVQDAEAQMIFDIARTRVRNSIPGEIRGRWPGCVSLLALSIAVELDDSGIDHCIFDVRFV